MLITALRWTCTVQMHHIPGRVQGPTACHPFLQAKPLTFLHVFHHTSVVPMAYLWLEQGQSLQQIALLTNTGIHVIMYW